jgi:hypothetical protein
MAKKRASQLNREIDEALSRRIDPTGGQSRRTSALTTRAAAKRANDQIYDLLHNRYFTAIPNDQLFGIVRREGFRFDPEEEQFILTGRDGRATWQLFDDAGYAVNHMLVLQWHKMDRTGRYEVVAYVS